MNSVMNFINQFGIEVELCLGCGAWHSEKKKAGCLLCPTPPQSMECPRGWQAKAVSPVTLNGQGGGKNFFGSTKKARPEASTLKSEGFAGMKA